MDLELVNAAMARNEALVIELLKSGADPTVDIFNRDAMIDLMDYLENKESLCFSDYNRLLILPADFSAKLAAGRITSA